MSLPFLPYALPELGEEEIDEVADTLRSGWLTTGPKAKRFEAAFDDYLGGGLECLAVNSATSGLHLALEALGIGNGDEVITSTLTFTATAEVARYLGANVRLVDVDSVTLNLDVEQVRAAMTPQTRAIIPVHYGGLACDMDAILTLAKENNLKVVEDAAHAMPSTWQRKIIGTLESDATVFSFYANKSITTGEGGMVVTRNLDIAKRIRLMRLHGINADAFDRYTSEKSSWYYEVVAPGFKYNMPDTAAAVGIHQLAKLPRFLTQRQHLATRYLEELDGLPLILPARAPLGDTHAWHLFVIRLSDEASTDRNEVIRHLSECGIGTSVHYVPLHRQPYWRDRYELKPDMFPEADTAYQRMLSLPLYSLMTDADQDRVIEALHSVLS